MNRPARLTACHGLYYELLAITIGVFKIFVQIFLSGTGRQMPGALTQWTHPRRRNNIYLLIFIIINQKIKGNKRLCIFFFDILRAVNARMSTRFELSFQLLSKFPIHFLLNHMINMNGRMPRNLEFVVINVWLLKLLNTFLKFFITLMIWLVRLIWALWIDLFQLLMRLQF